MEKMKNAYRSLVGQREGKRSFRRPRCRWETYENLVLWAWIRFSLLTVGSGYGLFNLGVSSDEGNLLTSCVQYLLLEKDIAP
jgi:hypothetical protein